MRYAIFYVSTAVKDLNRQEIDKILNYAKQYNNENNLTGILLYSEGNFFQVLEGEKSEVLKIYDQIQEDERHYNIIKIFSKEVPQRTFDGYEVDYISEDARYSSEHLRNYLQHVRSLDVRSQNVVREVLTVFIDSNK